MNYCCEKCGGRWLPKGPLFEGETDIGCPFCEVRELRVECNRLAAVAEKLRERLNEQTLQTQQTAEQIHHHVVDKLQRHNAIPNGIDPYGHPTEQIVGTCLSNLECRIEELHAIVATLPKCNRLVNGKLVQDVPVVPGMDIFFWEYPDMKILRHLPATGGVTDTNDMGIALELNDEPGFLHLVPPKEAYDTEEAARATAAILETCPGCGGVADNGFSRDVPPVPYYCTRCDAARAAQQKGNV